MTVKLGLLALPEKKPGRGTDPASSSIAGENGLERLRE